MPLRCAVVVGLALIGVAEHASYAQETTGPLLDRIVGTNITLKLPPGPCSVPALAWALAKAVNAPVGIETLPGECGVFGGGPPPPSATEQVPLLGLTLASALDLIAKADRRYYWTESNGVIVMRPVVAWGNKDHFLHTTLPGLELKDASLGVALDAVLKETWGPRPSRFETIAPGDPSLLNLSTGAVSMVQALDAIVRAHGSMSWQVTYCIPEVAPDVARLHFVPHDLASGVGAPVARPPTGLDGRPFDRCRGKR
jgi:hypothetical protein